jgi:lysophospholipase L1-like esterase
MPTSPQHRPSRLLGLLVGLFVAGALTAPATAAHASPAHPRWLGSWAAAPAGVGDLNCQNCTIRDVVHSTISGQPVRIRLSNVFGTAPLVVAHTTVALPVAAGSGSVRPGTLRDVTFGRSRSVTIPAGQSALSDPVPLRLPADSDLLVSTFTPGQPTLLTWHPDAQQTSYVATGADQAGATDQASFPQTTGAWYLVTDVEVTGTAARGDVVTFGDSITDGWQSTPNADHRWPDVLADRLRALPPGHQLGVENEGISGNRVLLDGGNGFGPSALSRYDRDVLTQPGARSVIILLGINDIQQTPHQLDPNAIIAGLRQLVDRAHARGIRVIGGTVLPFEGWLTYDAQEEAARQGVNDWIRGSHAFDAVVDFDAVTRDPADPHRMLPAYDSGDHLHPNDTGYAAMGNAVRLSTL